PADPSPRPALAGIPDEAGEDRPRPGELGGGEGREALVREPRDVAPRLETRLPRLAGLARVAGRLEAIRRDDVLDFDDRDGRRVGRRPGFGGSCRVRLPESRKYPVEDRDLLVAMDEQRPAGVIHLL